MNLLGINKRFSRVSDFQMDESEIVCPFEGTIQEYGIYMPQQSITAKSKGIIVDNLLGSFASKFHEGAYISAYLSPRNKHFRIVPSQSTVVHIYEQSGTARFLKTIV
jgi:phosphatidylserine decarboxylase